jgi:hypothetical protein
MKILNKIKSMFSGSKPVTENLQNQSVTNENLFYCHYCFEQFELLDKDKFSVSVPKIGSDYFFQGVGVQCPHCKKTCVCG